MLPAAELPHTAMEESQGDGGGLRRSNRVSRPIRRMGESQDFLERPDVRDAAGLPPLDVVDEHGGGAAVDNDDEVPVVLHRPLLIVEVEEEDEELELEDGGDDNIVEVSQEEVVEVRHEGVEQAEEGVAEGEQQRAGEVNVQQFQHEEVAAVVEVQEHVVENVEGVNAQADDDLEDNVREEGDEGEHGDRLDLTPFLQPTVQGFRLVEGQNDADGWMLIDRMSPMECLLTEFSMLSEVPAQHEAAYLNAVAVILTRWSEAQSALEENRALKWWFFLHQALLRTPRRGGKQGRQIVAARFNSLAANNWGKLVESFRADKAHFQERGERQQARRQNERAQEKEQERLQRDVLSLIKDGQVGKACSRITSFGVASAKDPDVKRQLLEKHPPRRRPMPASVVKGEAVENLHGLKEALSKLQRGIAPGCGGCRPEYLTLLGEKLSGPEMRLLEGLGMAYVRAELPPWVYRVARSVKSIAIYKTEEQDAVRPLGLGHTFFKVIHKEIISSNKQVLRQYLEPQQLILSPAGAPKIVFTVDAVLRARPDFVCYTIDIRNAFNEISRAAIMEVLEAEPSLRHLAQFMGVTMAPHNALESGGRIYGEAGDGVIQGSAEAQANFCAGIQPDVNKLDAACRMGEGIVVAGADDVNALGPPDVVMQAVATFKTAVRDRCGLELQVSKSRLFTWQGGLPAGAPPGLKLAQEEVGGQQRRGFICFGCPVGEDEYVVEKLTQIANRIVDDARKTVEVLAGNRQALWTVFRSSINHRFDYWCELVRPSLCRPVAENLDKELWSVLEAALGFKIPSEGRLLGEEGDFVLNTPVWGREAWPFAQWVVRQPVKLHGMGPILWVCEATRTPASQPGLGPWTKLHLILLRCLHLLTSWVVKHGGLVQILPSAGQLFLLLAMCMGGSYKQAGQFSNERRRKQLSI